MRAFARHVAARLTQFREGVRWRSLHWLRHIRARIKRRRLKGVTFVAVTGTAGKTTTKDLSAQILESIGPCQRSPRSSNGHGAVDRLLLATTSEHRFCVVEVSANEPGCLDRPLRAIKPHIAAVTLIAREHYSAFRSLEAIAAEKGKIVAALPRDGTAVLNIDDPLVREMSRLHPGPIIWVGKSEGATLQLLECHSQWPEPLTMRVLYRGKPVEIRTRLHGTHLTASVLSALGVALAAGATLEKAVAALVDIEPPEGRMQIVACEDGVTFVRDDWKAPQWSLLAPFEFMRVAQAERKVIVLGTISDSPKSPSQRYVHASREALGVADLVIAVGTQSLSARKLQVPHGKDLKSFATLKDAAAFLKGELRAGDLVLLKGTNKQDHLSRLVLDRTRPVLCWQSNCGRLSFCSRCPLAYIALHEGSSVETYGEEQTGPVDTDHLVVAGLGNPGKALLDTPHNVGQRVLDAIARGSAGHWEKHAEGLVCRIDLDVGPVVLLKPNANMNTSGAQIKRFLDRTNCRASNCIVVCDDFDLELGTCRYKRKGGDGGHKGMRSVIGAFGTDEFPRVRVGVRRPGEARRASEVVLAGFSSADEALLARGLEQAQSSIREIVKARARDTATLP